MSIKLGPKLRQLLPVESLSSLESWRQNVLYNLSLDKSFSGFLVEGFVFGKKSRQRPDRELTDDTDANGLTARAKCIQIDMMLEQIANWANVIARNDIVRDCESLDKVWQVIRLFYNLQTTGSLLNEAWNIKRAQDETPQALYSRIKQLYDDNLLKKGGLKHIDGPVNDDEEMSPTLHNTIVLHWLQVLHPRMRELVTQRFSSDLRNCTYATIFPEISRSVNDLLLEVDQEPIVCRAFNQRSGQNTYSHTRGESSRGRDFNRGRGNISSFKSRVCEYCRIADRRCFQNHKIEDCIFLRKDRQEFRSRAVDDYYEEQEEEEYDSCAAYMVTHHIINRVSSYASPVLPLYYGNEPVNCTLDSGATCSIINSSLAKSMRLQIKPTQQTARMADGKSALRVDGETEVVFYRNGREYHMAALVANFTDTDILAGMPFMSVNDIAIRPAKGEIIIDGSEIVHYDMVGKKSSGRVVKRVLSFDIVAPVKSVLLSGDSLELALPSGVSDTCPVVIEPCYDTACNKRVKETNMWPAPQLVEPVKGSVVLINYGKDPVILKKHERICKVYPSYEPSIVTTGVEIGDSVKACIPVKKVMLYTAAVDLNADKILTPSSEVQFRDVLKEYDNVFNPQISRYNGFSGPCAVEVNMGPSLPPQRKGRVPQYSKDNMDLLQKKFDELEAKGVFTKPQKIGVKVEYVSPSFLVKKPSGDYRLVTDFSSIAPYIKPVPTLLPDVNSTLLKVAAWKYLIRTDLTEAYFQIPLRQSSRKYCGVVSPYKGLLVYTTGCMGLPGVEVALEELTCMVLGDLVMLGIIAKIADDLYIGGSTEEELLENFRVVLNRFRENNLCLSARKTHIAPRSTEMLGWTWSSGKLQASAHRIAALSECALPLTVSAMKSFLGSYRFLSRVLKGYACLLEPLEAAIAGKDAKARLLWSDELTTAFKIVQESLKDNRAITLPLRSDLLWIVTDGSLKNRAVGATLYIVRDGVPKLGGFYNSRITSNQAGWLACEIEGLAIASALHHFAPLIRQSDHRPQVLTDSKPCVQACAKFMRGEFSASARLTTFLNAVGVYSARVSHVSGKANLASDFASRVPVECKSEKCVICKFVKELSESVVRSVSVEDFVQGKVRLPYTNRAAWLDTQKECANLRHVKFCLQQGSNPTRKQKRVKDVRRYLSSKVLVASDGLLVLREAQPLCNVNDRIVVPRDVVNGLVMALHIQCSHPTAYQLKRIFNRYFFALDAEVVVTSICNACQQCASLKDIPRSLIKESTEEPPENIGYKFAADVVRREGQKFFIMRETVTSYVRAMVIRDETASTLKDAIISSVCMFRPSPATSAVIRVDAATSFQSLTKHPDLSKHNILLEVGRIKNKNKNPVIDKAIKELCRELKIINPQGGPISATTLDLAVATLNSRLRTSGMSSHEMWTKRDQVSGNQIEVLDKDIIRSQHRQREQNHFYSEKSKSGGKGALARPNLSEGDLVYIYSDGNKLTPRPRYIVISLEGERCRVRKLNKGLYASRVYDLKVNEVYKVPGFVMDTTPSTVSESDTDDDDLVPISWEGPNPPAELVEPFIPPVEADIPNHPGSPVTGLPSNRPRREIKLPVRFGDYCL